VNTEEKEFNRTRDKEYIKNYNKWEEKLYKKLRKSTEGNAPNFIVNLKKIIK